MVKKLADKGAKLVGSFHCRGYDTFAFLGKIGGMAKGHPNTADVEKAVSFCQGLMAD